VKPNLALGASDLADRKGDYVIVFDAQDKDNAFDVPPLLTMTRLWQTGNAPYRTPDT
jgi:hypothetical protein